MRTATLRPMAKPTALLVLLILPLLASAESNRLEELKKLALACEQRGDWLEACRFYDEALRRDRGRIEFRDGYQRCLRQFHLQRRHRDAGYRDIVNRLSPNQALDIYEEVLLLLSSVYVDRNKSDLNALFQQGLFEVRSALNDDSFRQEYLPGASADDFKSLTRWLEEAKVGKVATSTEARDQALDLSRSLQQRAPQSRPTFGAAIILEFACGACNALDEYTLFLTPGHYADVQAMLRGKTVGVGIDLALVEQRVEIARVYPKSPARELGLMPGDRLLRIDRQPVDSLPMDFIVDRLRGEAGTAVELEVLPMGQMEPRVVKLSRRVVIPPSVEYAMLAESDMDPPIGYLRVRHFQESTLQEVKEALAQLNTKRMQAIILDLRGNPGGLFKPAVQVSELFLGEGVIVHTQTQVRHLKGPFKADSMNPLLVPMAVLIDGETASSAEVVAGAFKELGRAMLLGQTTFGKGSIQSVIPLKKSTGGVRITVAQFFSPSRQPYTGRGVAPDVFMEADGEAVINTARMQLQRLLRSMMIP